MAEDKVQAEVRKATAEALEQQAAGTAEALAAETRDTAEALAEKTTNVAEGLAEETAAAAEELALETKEIALVLASAAAERARLVEETRVVLADGLKKELRDWFQKVRTENVVLYGIAIGVAVIAVLK